ncbi:MAG: hypothetical protein HFJ33_05185 [Clostridia bacterium]|nr:hypothetical protein [Clostridia bacterium]
MHENIVQLKMKSQKDGKNYLTDTLDTKGILRLIHSIEQNEDALYLFNLKIEKYSNTKKT